MRVNLLFFVFIASFSNAFAQIYSGGNDDGFSVTCYAQADNPALAIYSGGNDDGFSVTCYAQADNPALAIYSGGNDDGFSFSCVGSVGNEVPLPIELISFEAACNKGSVYLKWVTASEINNDYFTIERTADGVSFEILGIVDGAGNSYQTKYYTFTDAKPLKGISYYRLKQTDFNGQFEYSNIISVNCINNNIGKINVYPNPITNELMIEIEGNNEPVYFEILNTLGQVVFKGNLVEKTTVQTSNFAPGVYLIKFTNGKTFEFKKIIKE
jgi:hypothetical protein